MAGTRVPIVFERRARSGGKVYVCDCGRLGQLSLPESFTDRGSPLGEEPQTSRSWPNWRLSSRHLASKKALCGIGLRVSLYMVWHTSSQ